MRVGVQKNRVLRTRQPGEHAEIGLIAGRENDAVFPVEEFRQRLLELLVRHVRAVRDPRTRGAGSKLVERSLSSGDTVFLERDPHVVVRAGENRLTAVDDCPGRRQHSLVGDADCVRSHCHHALEALDDGPVLVEQVLHTSSLLCTAASTTFTKSFMVRVSERTLRGISMSKWSSTSMTKSITVTESMLRSAEISVSGFSSIPE